MTFAIDWSRPVMIGSTLLLSQGIFPYEAG